MKMPTKSPKSEPTITDVMGAVQGLAVGLQDLTEAVQTGFAKVEERFERVDERFDGLEYRMTMVERRVGSLEETVDEMNDTLTGVAKAVDKDTLTLLDHSRRIRVLEKTVAA